jgi:hypothetical protein
MVFGGLAYQIYLKWKKLQRVEKKKQKSWSFSLISLNYVSVILSLFMSLVNTKKLKPD